MLKGWCICGKLLEEFGVGSSIIAIVFLEATAVSWFYGKGFTKTYICICQLNAVYFYFFKLSMHERIVKNVSCFPQKY